MEVVKGGRKKKRRGRIKGPRIAKSTSKKNKSGRFTLLDIDIFYKAMIMTVLLAKIKGRERDSGTELRA